MSELIKSYFRNLIVGAVSLLSVFIVFGLTSHMKMSDKASVAVFGATMFTSAAFCFFILDSRPWWGRKSFWALTGLLLAAHALALANLLTRFPFPHRIWWVIGMLIDVGALFLCRNWLLPRRARKRHR